MTNGTHADHPMNRMQATGKATTVDTADRFHPADGHPARSHAPLAKGKRHGKQDRQRSKGSSRRAPRRRLLPARHGHTSREPIPTLASSRLCPDLISFTLGRVDSSFRVLRLPEILAACPELRSQLARSLGDLDPGLEELIAERTKGARSNEPRVALMPLASVGHPQADGRLMAIGLAPRKDISPNQRHRLSDTVRRILGKTVALGKLGRWRLEPLAAASFPQNLLPETWTGQPEGATDWATVTPIVLDKQATDDTALCDKMAREIRVACRHQGLPKPCEIIITPISAHFGAPPADAFPRFLQQESKRPVRHAILIFCEPVHGPILLGAGRHDGYGLCRPMRDGVVDA